MTMNQLSYKVLSERSIFVFPDTPPKHAQYDEQVVRTFYLSHADATELHADPQHDHPAAGHRRAAGDRRPTRRPTRSPCAAPASVVQILEKIIEQNDKPRAEIVVDVEILEVDRSRTKNYGLNLSEYALGAIFSPEVVAERHDHRRDRRHRRHRRHRDHEHEHRHVDRRRAA